MKHNKTDLFQIPFVSEVQGEAEAPAPASRRLSRPSTAAEQWALRGLLNAVGKPPVFIRLWDGSVIKVGPREPRAGMVIHDRGTLWRLFANPGLYFGEAYSAGHIDVEGHLVEFLEHIYGSRPLPHERSAVSGHFIKGIQWRRRNTLNGSRHNIHHHYDIGNDFYRLWLDRDMVYTCAYFPRPADSLETAQQAKMEHVCRKLRLRPGETVVEAGCGWGALSRYMAREYGAKVKAYNISKEQIAYARAEARRQGLDGLLEFVEDDYRNIDGRYDAFVSVGMLEHVGRENYRGFGQVIDRCLKPGGRGLVHTIGQNQAQPLSPWLSKHIFPGAYPPTLREIMDLFEPSAFSVLDVENLRLHYAKTLEHWLARYQANEEAVRHMFDEPFVRTWRLYLAGSMANFTTGALQLYQVTFSRPRVTDVPWTRAYLYGDNKKATRWNVATS